MGSDEITVAIISVGALLSGVAVMVAGLNYRVRIRELRQKERLAMIERGLLPAPEFEPGAAPVASQRSLSLGIIVVGLGLGLIVLIGIAGGALDVGLGVGGAIAILGAAFIVRDVLESGGPVGREVEGGVGVARGIAWKTGTSFGFRDAWAVGVSDRFTVGVWVGRPDGTPNPGFFGANAAAPLLLDVFAALPDGAPPAPRAAPRSVTRERVCWPLGTRDAGTGDPRCHVRRTAWALDGAVPATFPDRLRSGEPRYAYHVDTVTGERVMPGCARHAAARVEAARWPAVLEPWLDPGLRARALPPAWSADCSATRWVEAAVAPR